MTVWEVHDSWPLFCGHSRVKRTEHHHGIKAAGLNGANEERAARPAPDRRRRTGFSLERIGSFPVISKITTKQKMR